MSKKLLVYVSGPYSEHAGTGTVAENIERAKAVCVQLWNEGYAVICPHTNTAHFNDVSTATYEDYIEGDLLMVERSDAIVMMEGWERSSGAVRELDHARAQAVPIYYWPDHPDKSNVVRNLGRFKVRNAGALRKFESGATRDTDTGKYDYEAFISPTVLERYGRFMHKNRYQKDGTLRDGDNWQQGIPPNVYVKSLIRHVIEAWGTWRRGPFTTEFLIPGSMELFLDTLCAIMFNTMGLIHEILKSPKDQGPAKMAVPHE